MEPTKIVSFTRERDQHQRQRARQRCVWCLRLVVLIQCIGLCGKYFLAGFESESDVYGFLFFDHQWPESTAQRIDDVGAIACLAAGVVVVLSGRLLARGRAQSLIDATCLFVIAAWFLAIATAHLLRGEPFASLSLGEQAVRYSVPLALAMMVGWNHPMRAQNERRTRIAMSLLVVATAATFVVHGYKAFVRYGPFTDLILLSDANLLGLGISQSTAEFALTTIGVIDIVVALLLVTTQWRGIAIYVAAWGLVTSFSRMTAFGFAAWPESLIRAANWGAPLALVIYHDWSKASVSSKDN